MPFIEIKTIKGVFSTDEKSRMIKDVTDVFANMKDDEFAEGTWVVVNELGNGDWGGGGAVLKAEHVPKSSAS